jgi:hypothetical protein
MSDPRLDAAFSLWQSLRERGGTADVEDVCRQCGCPELAGELARRAARILAVEKLMGLTTPEGADAARPRDAGRYPHFPGYEVLGELGRGGMGVVYRARELRGGRVVALKTIRTASAAARERFAAEFRALQSVCHRNLVVLYEVAGDEAGRFFTMELVEGADWLTHVGREGDSPAPSALPPGGLARLRDALRQLCEGLRALHARRLLHCDLKPSNVLVTGGGCVKILDFGLVAEAGPDGHHSLTDHQARGTWAYMAPEQGEGAEVSPVSDWYSVGVMLYQALTGRPPFAGGLREMQEARFHSAPPPPSALVPDVPKDLDRLCAGLLRPRPADRSRGIEMLCGLTDAEPDAGPEAALVGRAPQLAELEAALTAARRGEAVTVAVQGPSGSGKTALVEHFLGRVRAAGEAVVLAGRCYERESVPYKAVTGLIDALCLHLRGLPRSQQAAVLPRDPRPLARVFGALEQIPAVAALPHRPPGGLEPQELRRRAFEGLRELLARLGDHALLVLYIDDLQWGDLESALLLNELLRPPDPPRLLLVGCYRSEDAAGSPFLRRWLEPAADAGADPGRRELVVGELGAGDARELARLLLGAADERGGLADAIARESGGVPFLIHELARAARAGEREITPDRGVLTRITALPPEARRLLEAVAVAGRPVPAAVACAAAGLEGDESGLLPSLREARLLRSVGPAGGRELEAYHDRIRAAVLAGLVSRRCGRSAAAICVTARTKRSSSRSARPCSRRCRTMGGGSCMQAGTRTIRACAFVI